MCSPVPADLNTHKNVGFPHALACKLLQHLTLCPLHLLDALQSNQNIIDIHHQHHQPSRSHAREQRNVIAQYCIPQCVQRPPQPRASCVRRLLQPVRSFGKTTAESAAHLNFRLLNPHLLYHLECHSKFAHFLTENPTCWHLHIQLSTHSTFAFGPLECTHIHQSPVCHPKFALTPQPRAEKPMYWHKLFQRNTHCVFIQTDPHSAYYHYLHYCQERQDADRMEEEEGGMSDRPDFQQRIEEAGTVNVPPSLYAALLHELALSLGFELPTLQAIELSRICMVKAQTVITFTKAESKASRDRSLLPGVSHWTCQGSCASSSPPSTSCTTMQACTVRSASAPL